MSKKTGKGKSFDEEAFLETLKTAFKENLHSVMIYGSYLSGNFVEGVSDVNILILIKEPLIEQIESFGISAHKMMRRKKITPLILTKSEFINSADVFPMEYLEIKDNKKLLYGEDETRTLTLKSKNLRHQLEDRLRGNVASLRQLIIASGGKEKILGNNLKNWFGSLNALFKGLLRLKGSTPVPSGGKDTVEKIGEVFQFDINPFLDFIKFRSGEKINPKILTHNLLASLENLVSIIDKMDFKT